MAFQGVRSALFAGIIADMSAGSCGIDPDDEAIAATAARMWVLASFPIALSVSSATSFGRLVEPRTSDSSLELLPENGFIDGMIASSIGSTSGLLAAASLLAASACWFMATANCWAVAFACEAW